MLKSFYLDPEPSLGVNNRVFEGIGMPHVLIGLQGVPELVAKRPKALNLLAGNPLKNGKLVPAGDEGEQRFVPDRKNLVLERTPPAPVGCLPKSTTKRLTTSPTSCTT